MENVPDEELNPDNKRDATPLSIGHQDGSVVGRTETVMHSNKIDEASKIPVPDPSGESAPNATPDRVEPKSG